MTRPTIFVGAGTCGLGAGAQETLAAIHDYLDKREIKADVIKVGCIGLCSLEPIVDIQLPDHARVSFKQITAARVPTLLDATLSGSILERFHAGPTSQRTTQALAGRPLSRRTSVLAPQTRWVLANCGLN